MKLYFCAGCGVLHGTKDPEAEPDVKCDYCGEAFDANGTFVGEFSPEDARSFESLMKGD